MIRTTLIVVAIVGAVGIHAQDTGAGRPAFDIVSIKPNTSGTIAFRARNLVNGRAALTNVTVRALLYRAFDITADTPIDGLPSWTDTEHYNVEVRTAAMPSAEEQRDMWHALLVDRLKLASHDDMRDQPVYNLVVAQSDRGPGAGLTPSTVSCPERPMPPDIVAFMRNGPKLPPGLPLPNSAGRSSTLSPEFIAERLKICGTYSDGNTILSASMTMAALARQLTGPVERLVIDKTGLQGAYTVRMVSSPDDSGSLFTVLQEQLGLELESGRAPARVLVIDHIERPSQN